MTTTSVAWRVNGFAYDGPIRLMVQINSLHFILDFGGGERRHECR